MYNPDLGLFLLRAAIAAIFLWHGIPKLKMQNWMRWLGSVEIIAAVGLLLGVFAKLSALVLAIIMIGAIYHKIFKWRIPFWARDNTGWEFDLILFAANFALITLGGGSWVLFG